MDCYSGPAVIDTDHPVEAWQRHFNAVEDLRKAAAEVTGFLETASRIGIGIPGKEDLRDASANLLSLSNSVFYGTGDLQAQAVYNLHCASNVRAALGILPG